MLALAVCLLLAGVDLVTGGDPAALAAPLLRPDRQTVPLTPPPTWTRPPAPPTATRTRAVPPTSLPTLTPTRAKRATSAPTHRPPTAVPPATAAPPPEPSATAWPSPTSLSPAPTADARPVPWVALEAAPALIAPGVPVTVTVRVSNAGNLPLGGARVTLSGIESLSGIVVDRQTEAQVSPQQLAWPLASLAPGEERSLTLHAQAGGALLPASSLALQARLEWSGGSPLDATASLNAPWALLPDVGRAQEAP